METAQDNQAAEGKSITLPIHPRKAQELFFELLQVPSSSTDSKPPTLPFKQRLAQAQTEYAGAVAGLQRGRWLRCPSISTEFLLLLQLSADGTRLEVSQFIANDSAEVNDDDSDDEAFSLSCIHAIELASIQRVVLHEDGFFSIHTAASAFTFMAESQEVFTGVAVALAVSVSATGTMARANANLLWQAVRLRGLELVREGGDLRAAIATMETAYDRILKREIECDLPDSRQLFVLQTQ